MFTKRKKLEIRAVFNADEDDTTAPKKRKLVPLGNIWLAHWNDTRAHSFIHLRDSLSIDYGDELAKKEKDPKNSEEKRKNIKSLIEKIPTDKASLFAHPVEWSLVDNVSFHLSIHSFIIIFFNSYLFIDY